MSDNLILLLLAATMPANLRRNFPHNFRQPQPFLDKSISTGCDISSQAVERDLTWWMPSFVVSCHVENMWDTAGAAEDVIVHSQVPVSIVQCRQSIRNMSTSLKGVAEWAGCWFRRDKAGIVFTTETMTSYSPNAFRWQRTRRESYQHSEFTCPSQHCAIMSCFIRSLITSLHGSKIHTALDLMTVILSEFCSEIPIVHEKTTVLQLMNVSSGPHSTFETTFRQRFSLPIEHEQHPGDWYVSSLSNIILKILIGTVRFLIVVTSSYPAIQCRCPMKTNIALSYVVAHSMWTKQCQSPVKIQQEIQRLQKIQTR